MSPRPDRKASGSQRSSRGSDSASDTLEHAAGSYLSPGSVGHLAKFPPPGSLARVVAHRAAQVDHAAAVECGLAADAGREGQAAPPTDRIVDAAGGCLLYTSPSPRDS